MTRNQRSALVAPLAFGALLLGAATAPTSAEPDPLQAWSTVASTGVLDEASRDKARVARDLVTFERGATGAVTIRYNVTANDVLMGTEEWNLAVAFRDLGSQHRVRAFLIERPLAPGPGNTLIAFDSDDYEAGAHAEIRTETVSATGEQLDFRTNAYCLEVILTKYESGGRPPIFLAASLSPAAE